MMKLSKLTLAATSLAVVLAADTAVAHPKNEPHAKAVKLTLKGQVNRALLWLGNGTNSNWQHVDNDNSSSRVNFTGLGKINNKLTVGTTIEVEIEPNSSASADVHSSSTGGTTFQRRKVEAFFKHATFGELYIGHGATASDGTMEATDFSRTNVVSDGASVQFTATGLRFIDTSTGGKAVVDGRNLTVGAVFDSADGNSRRDRIRWNSKQVLGVSFQTSHAYVRNNDDWDVALKGAWSVGKTKLRAQAAYVTRNSHFVNGAPGKFKQYNGSVAVLFPVGISLMFAGANRNWAHVDARNGQVLFAKLGYQTKKIFKAGTTAVSIDCGQYTSMFYDTSAGNAKDKYRGRSTGLFLVQFIDSVGTEIYGGVRQYKVAGPADKAAKFKDATAVMIGTRVKF